VGVVGDGALRIRSRCLREARREVLGIEDDGVGGRGPLGGGKGGLEGLGDPGIEKRFVLLSFGVSCS
jgi:hypothetical protein